MLSMKTTLPLLLLMGAGLLLARSVQSARRNRTEPDRTEPDRQDPVQVRAAGPEAMQTPPERWDIVDEQSDQSFPASDPPGNY